MALSYDFIIIGAGSAGCLLAQRASEDPSHRVLLVEAGPTDKKREIHIPAAFGSLFRSNVDWAFETEPVAKCGNRRMFWPRGKVLGGSSSINAMVYIRGHRWDYDHWLSLGNPGWGFEDVLPFFRKSQNQERGESLYHGVGGPLNVADPRYLNPLSIAFLGAATELGYPLNEDFNGPIQEGFGSYQVTQKGGRRHSAASSFLGSALRRRNLTVLTGALVTRILFDGDRAAGIEYRMGGETSAALADREVILSAGAVGSPHLLMLSGVGPEAALRRAGVPVLHRLDRVGRNLQDHLMSGPVFRSKQAVSLLTAETPGNFVKWLITGRGPLTSVIAEAGGFVRTQGNLPVPDLQFHFAPVAFVDHGFYKFREHAFTIGATLLRPKSRGWIELATARPEDPPRIQPNYLTDDNDWQVLLRGHEIARRLAASQAMFPFTAGEHLPGSRSSREFIEQHVQTLYHPVGTCAMGRNGEAVVDSRLRVHGLRNLRVVDASIMPEIVGGNTNAPAIMIAERAAGWILNP